MVIVAAVVFAYQPAWNAGYIWDDDFYVTKNRLLTAADGWWRIWFTFDAPSQYFPLTYSTFRIEQALWGFAPAGYHMTNILLHAGSALLLWSLLRKLNVSAAWFAAALWALHPVQVESVAWVTERKNVLMALFFLASLTAWVRLLDEGGKRAWRWFAGALASYLLALAAKTTACTLPAALVLILWWKREPLTLRRWLQIAPFVLLGFAAGIISVMWERLHEAAHPDYLPIPLVERTLIASRAVFFYLSKLAWPAQLIFSYPRWEISATHPADYLWLVALVIVVALLVIARRRLGRGPEVAFAFFVATLSPLLGFAVVVTFLYSFVADHYQYLACIGPLTVFASACRAGANRLHWPNKFLLARIAAAAVLVTLAGLTFRQCQIYRNEETLWLRTIAQNPASWMARNQLAAYWIGEGRYDDAIAEYRKVVDLRPNESLGYANLGAALADKGENDAAVAAYEQALRLAPDDPRVERNFAQSLLRLGRIDEALIHLQRAVELRLARNSGRAQVAEIEVEVGNVYAQKGATTEAIERYRAALQLRPDYAAAHSNLGIALAREGRTNEAIAEYRAALASRSNEPAVHINPANVLLQQREYAEALRELEAAVALAPQSVPALTSLAQLLAAAPNENLRDSARALRLAERAVALTHRRDAVCLRSLAAAFAANAKTAEAINAIDDALTVVQPDNARLVETLRRDRERYAAALGAQR